MINFTTDLLDYQNECVAKLSKLTVGALFMEQGTGKTRTALELIRARLDAGKVDRVLWLCPCSVKGNLKADIIKHCGSWPDCIHILGIESISSSLKAYGLALQIVDEDKKCYLIVDESLLVKNPQAKRTERIISLSKKCKYKLILNGTPFSKNEADLFTQFYILDSRILGYNSYYSFAANHLVFDDRGRIVRVLDTEALSRKIAPYSFQVCKKDVLKLPCKSYHQIFYRPTPSQISHYRDVAEQFFMIMQSSIDTGSEWETTVIYRMFNALQSILSGRYITDIGIYKSASEAFFEDDNENPRLNALMDGFVDVVMVNGDKGIIFAKYSEEIKSICRMVNAKYGEGTAVIYDGSVSPKNREVAMQNFRTEARFLVSTKSCAGFGLNLQFCNNICFYNNDWDYATRAQAEDRIHRMGQAKECNIYDVTSGAYIDAQILDCVYRKENAVTRFKNQVSKDTLMQFIGLEPEEDSQTKKAV